MSAPLNPGPDTASGARQASSSPQRSAKDEECSAGAQQGAVNRDGVPAGGRSAAGPGGANSVAGSSAAGDHPAGPHAPLNPRPNPYVGPRPFERGETLFGRDRETNDLLHLLLAERIILLYSPSGAGKTSLIQAGLLPRLEQEEFTVLPVMRVGRPLTSSQSRGIAEGGEPSAGAGQPSTPQRGTDSSDGVPAGGRSATGPGGASLRPLPRSGAVPEFGALPKSAPSAASGSVAGTVLGGNRYVLSLLFSLEQSVDAAQRIAGAELASLTLDAYLARRELGKAAGSMALVFDQFEEILTVDPTDRAGKEEFFAQVGAALRNRSRWALFSMREEYRAGLDPYLRPIPTRFSSTFRLDLLEERAARLAIQQPARAAGVAFDDDAAQQLVDELRRPHAQQGDVSLSPDLGLYIEPLQLQVVCRRLWERLPPDAQRITAHDVAQTGQVDTALADYYADSVRQVAAQTQTPERLIREWFDEQLITPQGIRGQVLREPAHSGSLANAVVAALENVHLVRAEARRGETWYELAHDRLIAPVRQNNAEWFTVNLSTLQRQAKLWDENHRQEGFLLNGQAWTDVDQWLTANPSGLNTTEQDFVAACRRVQAQRARELIQNEQIWQRGVAAIVVSVFALLALLVAIVLGVQVANDRQLALSAEARAIDARSTAVAEAGSAVDAQATAVAAAVLSAQAAQDAAQARAAAVSARESQNVQYATSLAINAPFLTGEDPELALLLALKSVSVAYTLPGEEALHQVIENSHIRRTLTITSVMRDAAFSPDGRRVVTAGENGRGTVWNAGTGERLFDLTGHGNPLVLSAEYNDKGSLIVTAGGDHNAILWDAATGTRLSFLGDHADKTIVNQAAFSADGRWIVSGGTDKTARIWDVDACLKTSICHSPITFTAHLAAVNSVAFDPSGEWVASVDQAGTIYIWNRSTGQPRLRIPSNVSAHHVAFNPHGDRIVTAHDDGEARIWNVQTGDLLFSLAGDTRAVLSANYNAAGDQIVTAGADGRVLVWEASARGGVLTTLNGHTGGVHSANFDRSGYLVVSASDDNTARVWDTRAVEAAILHGHTASVLRAVFNADGTQVASASEDGTVRVWDARSGSVVTIVDQFSASVLDVAFSPDSRYLAAASADGTARVWDAATRQLFLTLAGHAGAVTGIAYSPDGKTIATSSEDRSIRLWDALSGAHLATISAHYPMNAVAFSPDGTTILSGDSTPGEHPALAQLWDAHTGGLVQTFHGITHPILAANFSPDGKRAVTAGGGTFTETLIRIWDVAAGTELTRMVGHSGRITSAVFSPDGARLLSASRDQSLRFWDAATGQQLMRLRGNPALVTSAAYSRDGKYYLTTGTDGDVRIYLTHMDDILALARSRVTRDFTCAERQRFLDRNTACN